MRSIILSLLVCISVSLTACGGNITSSKSEIATKVKQIIKNEKVSAGKEFTVEALDKLDSELLFINEDKIENISVTVAFSGKDYNSLGKDFYDIQIHGVLDDKNLMTELFLFTDEEGKVVDVGTWSRTLN